MSEQTEEEYLIERLSKLLAEISVIVNGPQPMGVLWSYADLPQKVQALKDAAALNAQDGVVEAWTHGCDALLNNVTLWIPRCPHCGKPALAAVKGVES